jgi:uncharacterized protein YjlB
MRYPDAMKIPARIVVQAYRMPDDGLIPNSRLPLLVYPGALKQGQTEAFSAGDVQELFARHDWKDSWINGVYDYHHYHSIAHEALGCFHGSAMVLFGGERGTTLEFKAGDVVVIPAGVGHKNLGNSADFSVVGAYPGGMDRDLCRGDTGERPQAIERIRRVPLPALDPVYGKNGPLHEHWAVGA